MKHPLSKSGIAAVAFFAVLATSVQAQVISWNLDDWGTVSGAGSYAGVVSANNWNNSWPGNPTSNLMDNSGAATTLGLAYGSFNTWHIQASHPGPDADSSYNRELLNGYLNAGPAGWGPPVTNSHITLSQIPYAQYDVYVYFSSDVADRHGSVTDGATTYFFSTIGPGSVSGANALFAGTTDTSGLFPQANYARFSGTGSSLTLTCDALSGNDQWLGIAGFQVVAVPEPGIISVAMLGGLTLLRFRRRLQS